MDELAKALKDFITRDLLYVVGGGMVGLSFCHLLKIQVPDSPSTALILLAAGIAYGVGYAIQDGLSLTGIVTTAPVVRPGPIVRSLYRRFVRAAWSPIESSEFDQAQGAFTTIASDRDYAQWNRIVSLKHIGSTLGTSALVTALLLLIAASERGGESDTAVVAIGALILSVTLIGLSWVNGAQQSQFVLSVYRRSSTVKNESGASKQGAGAAAGEGK